MALKNSYSESTRTFDRIQKALATHKAKQIMFDYTDDGMIQGIAFLMEIRGQMVGFKLPARWENVTKIMYPRGATQAQRQQAYRTAWANIRDWIEAQMAMIDTEMVKPEEVFLPYATDRSGKTLFERFESGGLQLGAGDTPPSPNPPVIQL